MNYLVFCGVRSYGRAVRSAVASTRTAPRSLYGKSKRRPRTPPGRQSRTSYTIVPRRAFVCSGVFFHLVFAGVLDQNGMARRRGRRDARTSSHVRVNVRLRTSLHLKKRRNCLEKGFVFMGKRLVFSNARSAHLSATRCALVVMVAT